MLSGWPSRHNAWPHARMLPPSNPQSMCRRGGSVHGSGAPYTIRQPLLVVLNIAIAVTARQAFAAAARGLKESLSVLTDFARSAGGRGLNAANTSLGVPQSALCDGAASRARRPTTRARGAPL